MITEEGVADEPVAEEKPEKVKKPKGKKRPSDFEIVRSILQRTSERKHAYLLKNLGEDSDVLFLCSKDEGEFTYGSPEISISMIKITDPELKAMVDSFLVKMYGLQADNPMAGFVCLRDQISELSKTKGEAIEQEVATNEYGSAWVWREDNKGKIKPFYYAKAIESLFHVQLVASYCKSYRHLFGEDHPEHLYYPYTHTAEETASILRLEMQEGSNHPLAEVYPNGFRSMVTKGLDVIITKGLTGDFPYPVLREDMIVFCESGVTTQLVHRVQAQGWEMLLVRPNAVMFPTPTTTLRLAGLHQL